MTEIDTPRRHPKKVLVALPPGLIEQIDYVAQSEHRTRSDLIREALRRYLQIFRQNNPQLRAVPTRLEQLLPVLECAADSEAV